MTVAELKEQKKTLKSRKNGVEKILKLLEKNLDSGALDSAEYADINKRINSTILNLGNGIKVYSTAKKNVENIIDDIEVCKEKKIYQECVAFSSLDNNMSDCWNSINAEYLRCMFKVDELEAEIERRQQEEKTTIVDWVAGLF